MSFFEPTHASTIAGGRLSFAGNNNNNHESTEEKESTKVTSSK
jgi:hypothetical protein